MARKAVSQEIPEAKIRNAIWYLKNNKTKKFVCEFLGIAYNTKKLDTIIEDFHKRLEREAALKKNAKAKVFSEQEKKNIANAYLAGETQSAISKDNFISPQRVKNMLIEMGVPIRGRGKKSEAKVDHIIQDLDSVFKKGDKVFLAKFNGFGIIDTVFDEEYLEYLESGKQRYVETYRFKPDKNGMSGKYFEPAEGVHYEIYWTLPDGTDMKLRPMQTLRNRIMKTIEETGREYYLVWREGDEAAFYYFQRDQLYPIKVA